MKMKTKFNIAGWLFSGLVGVLFCLFILGEYPNTRGGYTKEQRAAMNMLVDQSTDLMDHLSVADIGLDAELVMDEAGK